MFTCPKCDNVSFDKLSAWKRHMTAAHDGWTEEELRAADIAGSRATAVAGKGTFADYASTLPEDASEIPFAAGAETEATPEQPQVSRKKINADMRKLKKLLAEKLPRQLFHAIAVRTGDPRWELDYEEAQTVEEGVAACLDILGVELQIEQKNIVLRSRLWALLFPVVAVLTVVSGKLVQLDKRDSSSGGTDAP